MTPFISCRTCGRWLPAANLLHKAWCSEECGRAWSTCTTCGSAFPRGQGSDTEHCSRDCTVQYRISRKYGPEPITVVTEV